MTKNLHVAGNNNERTGLHIYTDIYNFVRQKSRHNLLIFLNVYTLKTYSCQN